MKASDLDRVKHLMGVITDIDQQYSLLVKAWEDRAGNYPSPIPRASMCWLSIGQWQPGGRDSNTLTFQIHLTHEQVVGILRNYDLARECAVTELNELGVTEVS